ncbi:type-2 angiotensin II receptor [Melanerpes formicivorus]|uniref:type-2 angiotensin II receptor n=1 Tax=Melanerpes formicivorus TaxID=211600 RepID=UPI00358F6551
MQSNFSLASSGETLRALPTAAFNASSGPRSAAPCPLTSSDYQFSLIPALFSAFFLLGSVGNSVVVAVLCRRGGPGTAANVYICNLAAADLLCLATLPFWATYYAQGYDWPFGALMCKVCSSVLCLNMFASIFFITCMSVERYRAVAQPLRSQRRTPQQARWVALGLWVLACLASLPTFYFRDTHYVQSLGVTACVMAFPQEAYASWAVATALLKNALGFLVPLAVISTCYLRIRRHLLRARNFGKSQQRRDKVLKLVAAVVVAFLVSWLPFHLLTFLDAMAHLRVIESCEVTGAIDAALPFSICMALSNSCTNPLLYCFIGNQFQERLHHLFKRRVSRLSSHQESSSWRRGSCPRAAETPLGRGEGPESQHHRSTGC